MESNINDSIVIFESQSDVAVVVYLPPYHMHYLRVRIRFSFVSGRKCLKWCFFEFVCFMVHKCNNVFGFWHNKLSVNVSN